MPFSRDELLHKRVGVLLGGTSSERDVSLRTGAAVAGALKAAGFDVRTFDVGPDIARQLLDHPVDVAFIALHGRLGEDGCIQGLLETMGIPYTGSGVLASAVAMDKVASKRLWASAGIPVAGWTLVDPRAPGEAPWLPCIVKPSREGSSVGVSLVRDAADYAAAVGEAARHAGEVLVEEYVQGREVNVGILHGRALGAVEIETTRAFYDYVAKYTPGHTQYHLPPRLPDDVLIRVLDTGAAAARALGCSGQCRTDLIVRADGSMVVLEVNTLPGMTETSLLPKIAATQGISFTDLCVEILSGGRIGA